MRKTILMIAAAVLTACASTNYQPYEARNAVVEGQGGSKTVVDGVELWENGDPPRTFKIIGIIDDSRPGGLIPMARLRSDIARKAKEAGGDAAIKIYSQQQINGYFSTGGANVSAHGNHATAYGSSYTGAARTNTAKFVVIQYLD